MTDQVTIQKAPTGDDPAHVAAMIAKVDGTPEETAQTSAEGTPAEATGERPAWLPEKFKSPEDMAKAYAELESKQGSGKKPEEALAGDPPAPEGDGSNPDADAAAKTLSDKGLDINAFSTEFAEKGELSAESYGALEKAGIPKPVVDAYIEGQKALASQKEADIRSASGDTDFDEVHSWAAQNLSKEDALAYNAAIDSGDVAQAKLAVAGLTQKYLAANPSEGKLLGGRTAAVSGDVYESVEQVTKDMSDPEYKRDPAFRKKVQDKIARSNVF